MHRSSDLEQKYDILPTEKVQLNFCKSLLGVHTSAANNAVRAELGIFPLAVFCLKSCVNYWLHVIELSDNDLVYNAYSDEISRDTRFSHKIKLFLGKINFSHVWANQNTFSKAKLLHAVTVRLKNSYIPFWRRCLFDDSEDATNGNKLRTYRTFKTSYCLEIYLLSSNNSRKEIGTFAEKRIVINYILKKVDIEEYHCKKEYAICAVLRWKTKSILCCHALS